MNVIIIRRGNDNGDAEIFNYLSSVFNSDTDGICRHIDIRDKEDIVEGVRKMTGLGEAIANKNYRRGKLSTLVDLVNKGMLTIASASSEANLSEQEFEKYLKEHEECNDNLKM